MGELYAALIRYLPIGAAKNAGGSASVPAAMPPAQAEKMRDFLSNKDRFEKVSHSRAIEGY